MKTVQNITKYLLRKIIRVYQYFISPLFGPKCRHYPSCSNYAIEAVEKLPLYKALPKIIIRVLKCNPLFKGGYDPVQKEKLLIITFLVPLASLANALYPSILLFHKYDLDNRCIEMANKVINIKAKKAKLVFTTHVNISSVNKVISYCYKDNSKCIPITKKNLNQTKEKLARCINYLTNNDVEVLYTPHLDAYSPHTWRNYLDFNPLEKIAGVSYYEHSLKFLNSDLIKNSQRISISVQSEMGRSIFKYPKEYLKIFKLLHSFTRGISLNFSKANGSYYEYNISDLDKLFKEAHFIGFSAYNPIKTNLTAYFYQAKHDFVEHIGSFGLAKNFYSKVIITESGLGGGSKNNDFKTIAKNAQELIGYPYSGLKDINPWLNLEYKNIRRSYYKELLNFTKYDQTDAYMWNSDSWDPIALYPTSKHFKDSFIFDLILNQ
jgi:putative membrane protein insertion efficiency factor